MSYVDIKNVGMVDMTTTQINPAQDESIILLRRLLQLAQTLGVVDSTQRQRVTVEVLPNVVIGSGTITTVSTVSTVSSVSNIVAYAGIDPRYQFLDSARNAYANSIRTKLIN